MTATMESTKEFKMEENEKEKKDRMRSHMIIYVTLFVQMIGFSIVITGIFPYLKLLEGDPHLSKTYLGWVIAVNPVGQTIFSPILGIIYNRIKTVRRIFYCTIIIQILANVLYGILPYLTGYWDQSYYHFMIISRFLVGSSSASTGLCRAYLGSSSTLEERTSVLSYSAVAQSMSFIAGPAIQLLVSLSIANEQWQYQSTGFIAAGLGIINLLLISPFMFKEFDLSAQQMEFLTKDKKMKILPKPDKPALIFLLYITFVAQFNYILIEILLEPLAQDQYAWCDYMAVIIVGVILFSSGGILAISFVIVGKLARKINERKLLIGGFFISICGFFLMLPWGPNSLIYCESKTEYYNAFENYNRNSMERIFFNHSMEENRGYVFDYFCKNVTECLGCPPQQEWCKYTPQLPLPQLLISFFLIFFSFPFGITISQALASKMLGPRPQGTWMGLMTSTGGLSRAISPVFVSLVYVSFGTRYVSAIIIIFLTVSLLQSLYFYKRLTPLTIPKFKANAVS